MRGVMSLAIFAAFAVVVVLPQVLFIVNETDQAIITQFGEYRRTVSDPGLHVKLPVVQTVHLFERRILSSDANPQDYLTLDKKRLVVDHITRWRIVDPLQFYKTVQHVQGASRRLDDIVDSELRRATAKQEFSILISSKREAVMEAVAKSASEQAKEFGIDIQDVRIKRADLPPEVQQSVFSRMVAERERIAKRYRSEGEEEAVKIRAETDKRRTILIAEAYQESQGLRGAGDAEATRIAGEAYGQEPELYRLLRSLEAFEAMFGPDDQAILSTESDLIWYLQDSDARRP